MKQKTGFKQYSINRQISVKTAKKNRNNQYRELNGGYHYGLSRHQKDKVTQQLYAQMFNKLKDTDQFLESHKLPKLKQEVIGIMNHSITTQKN